MKIPPAIAAVVFVLVALALSVWVVYQRNHIDSAPGDNEAYAHKIARYRAGADAALPAAITNAVIGLRTILSQHTETYDENFNKWTAEAEVEYINSNGGVDRTNLEFFFSGDGGKPSWWPKYQ